MSSRPILQIDLNKISSNYKVALSNTNAKVACAVKANAYGLGAKEIVHHLTSIGCKDFYFMYVSEALDALEDLQDRNIYILSPYTKEEFAECINRKFIPVINSMHSFQTFRQIKGYEDTEYVLHVDTGMTRVGINMADIEACPPYKLVMSHLSCADEPDHPMNQIQLERMLAIKARYNHAHLSLANSSGIFLGAHYHFDQVRPGCMLYGVNPIGYQTSCVANVVKLLAKVIQIRQIDQDSPVSYGAKEIAKKGSKIATIACGYADGYKRILSFNSYAMFNGKKLPFIGRITMDFIMLDVSDLTDTELENLDYVELINDEINVDILAKKSETIGYEILTSLGNRFHRMYLK